ncbi:MAG: glycosyltransferase family 87 protein [Phycisphaerales bacterium]|jgi:hypothetical protein|nr:glycosyltransferase family 87 protein [Phycisphaerales bacterium]
MPKHKNWLKYLTGVISVWIGLALIYGWKSTQFMLVLYDQAATTMINGGNPEGVPAMAYPPLLVSSYIPFCEFGDSMQRFMVFGVMACLLVFIFSTIQKYIVGDHSSKSSLLYWILVALVAGRHVTSPIENYSHDILISAIIILALSYWAIGKEGRGGASIGVAAACKATPLLFLPFLLLQRRWKAAIVMAIVTVVAFELPDIFFPRDVGSWSGYWFSIVTNSLNQVDGTVRVGNWTNWNQLNQSLAGTITRLFSEPPSWNNDAVGVCIIELSQRSIKLLVLISRLVVFGIIVLALYRPVKSPTPLRRFCEGSMIVCGMLLISPMSSKAHFFVLLLPATIMVRYYLWEYRDKLIATILIIMFFYGTLSTKGFIGNVAGHAVLETGSVTWCTLLAMLGTWRVMYKLPKLTVSPNGSV